MTNILGHGVTGLTLGLAAVLALVPLPGMAAALRPAWVPLFVLCWLIVSPRYCGLWFAWLAGLMLDLLYGSLLGQHALAMFCMVLAAGSQSRFIVRACWWQECCVVLLSTGLYELVVLCVDAASGRWSGVSAATFLAPVSSALVWPVAKALLWRLGRVLAL